MKKRPGPAPKGEYVGKSAVLSTRITQDLRDALESAASTSERSLSQEIEYRLRRSFREDQRVADTFGSRQNYALLRILAGIFDQGPVPASAGLDDPANFNHVMGTITTVLSALRPDGAEAAAHLSTDQFLGDLNAAALADDLAGADASMPPSQSKNRLNYVKADLGKLADRLKSLEGSGMALGERATKGKSK